MSAQELAEVVRETARRLTVYTGIKTPVESITLEWDLWSRLYLDLSQQADKESTFEIRNEDGLGQGDVIHLDGVKYVRGKRR